MPVDLNAVNFDHAEDVTDIQPEPTLAVSDGEHHIGALGNEGKRLMLELLDDTDENEPMDARVFDRLGLAHTHAEWNGYDLYWADAPTNEVVAALERWNAAQSM